MSEGECEVSECSRPCRPDIACDECVTYWQRMRAEGYWVDGKGWTEKGWREMLKGTR